MSKFYLVDIYSTSLGVFKLQKLSKSPDKNEACFLVKLENATRINLEDVEWFFLKG